MDDLKALRDEIDKIDTQITALFEARMDVVRRVGRLKQKTDTQVLQPGREKQVLEMAVNRLANKDYAPAVKQLFETMMAQSRAYQQRDMLGENPKVSYPGARGAFSHQAAITFFGQGGSFTPYETFEGAVQAAAAGETDYAVLPVENSTAGQVSGSMELLSKYHLRPVGWQVLQVRHDLWGVKGSSLDSIRRVLSHPQAIAQCGGYLKSHPHMTALPRLNTALAAKETAWAGDIHTAAIAGPQAGEEWGLVLLKADIQDSSDNHTRFVIAGREK